MRAKHKFRTYYYGNFATREALGRELNAFREPKAGAPQTKALADLRPPPRFGNNYARAAQPADDPLRGLQLPRLPAPGRGDRGLRRRDPRYRLRTPRRWRRSSGARTTTRGGGGSRRAGVEFELQALPRPVEILVGAVKQVERTRARANRWSHARGRVRRDAHADYGLFAAKRSVPARALPAAPEEGLRPIVAKLRAHGLAVEESS